MYDCKLMEIRRAFFAGWMGCGALFFVVDGGWRMADARTPGRRVPVCSGLRRGLALGAGILLKPCFKKSELALAAAQTRTF